VIPLKVRPPSERRPGVISVTLPSRGRPGMLAASIGSLRERAHRPDLLEILVAHDPDDQETAQAALDLGADVVWEAPKRYGYADSACYYAELIQQARGEWCLPTWGDDGLMRTRGWDDIVRRQPQGSVLWVAGNVRGLTCYPIVHMDVFAVLGRLCPLPALDTWYELVGQQATALVHPDPRIYVLQDRFDLTGKNNDITYQEGRSGYRAPEFFSPAYTELRSEDAAVLGRHFRLVREMRHRMATWSDIQEHMPTLRDAVRRYPDAVVVELGTRTGQSTAALLTGASAVRGRVWSVDVGAVDVPNWWFDTGLWSFLDADDMSDEAAQFVPDEIDVLFIDTSHFYEHTLAELHRYVPRVRPGGVVLCHDTELSAEQMAGYLGQPVDGPEFPVAAALDEFCAATGLKWTNAPNNFGLGTIEIS
jgi:hypothetical protein